LFRVRFTPDPRAVNAAAASGQPTPQAAAETCVSDILTALGAGHVFVAIEDPSAPGSWTAIVEKRIKPGDIVEAIEPIVGALPSLRLANVPTLDAEIFSDEARAVALALLKDTDPDRLEGMAACFAPDLPVVGALLHTKARLERTRRESRPVEIKAQKQHEAGITERLNTKLSHLRRGALSPPKDVASLAVDALRSASLGLGAAAASTWDHYGGAIRTLLPEDPPVTEPVTYVTNAGMLDSVDIAAAFDGVCRSVAMAATTPADLAEELGTSIDAARAVLSCTNHLGGGVTVIDALKAAPLCQLAPIPSASAIQLAAGQVRPLDVGLSDPVAAGRTLLSLQSTGRYDPAKAQVDRAKRAVARRVWVEWWARAERAGMLGNVR
jgi:hypothetical protein